MADIAALRQAFRDGRHAQAIADAEAALLREPQDVGLRRLCATMHGMTGGFDRSRELLLEVRARDPGNPDVLFNIGMCEREMHDFQAAARTFRDYTERFPAHVDGWAALADSHEALGQPAQAVAAYRQLLALAPGDDAALKKANMALLQLDRGPEAIELCREVLRLHPGSLTARLGAEWTLSQLVPLYHVPMMNEEERNQAYWKALEAADLRGKLVLEIGTGSGLLAMMAAKLGAAKVVTCEASTILAGTARKIVERNGMSDRVAVLAKPSQALQVGQDLPEKADVLVHEIFSSELLGEHVLPALEDARARLLKPGGRILPGTASIMVALVGGEALGRELHVERVHGFDLSDFNAIHPRKRPIHREDLPRELLSAEVEAFRFDFQRRDRFPPEKKRLQLRATGAGRCHGVIQWIRFEFDGGAAFENHPGRSRPVANWQHTIYRFEQPMELQAGQAIAIDALHDRSQPWFELAAGSAGT